MGLLTRFTCAQVSSFQILVLEKTLGSPLDSNEIWSVSPKGNQSWIFIGRTDGEAPILWPPNVKSQLIRKDPDAGNDWGQKEKRAAEDEMVGWHQWLNRHEFEQAPGDSEGQGGLVCCSPWGHKQTQLSDWTTTLGTGRGYRVRQRYVIRMKALTVLYASFFCKVSKRCGYWLRNMQMTQQNRTESPEIDQIPRGNLAYNNNSISNHSNIDYLKNCIKIND